MGVMAAEKFFNSLTQPLNNIFLSQLFRNQYLQFVGARIQQRCQHVIRLIIFFSQDVFDLILHIKQPVQISLSAIKNGVPVVVLESGQSFS